MQRQNSGQLFSFIFPEQGQSPLQQMYRFMSPSSAFRRFAYDAQYAHQMAKQKTAQEGM
jgi:hypothetical protein